MHRNEERIEESAGLDDLTRRYTDEALSFVRRHADRPFYLYIAHTMRHVVLGASEPFQGVRRAASTATSSRRWTPAPGRPEAPRRLHLGQRAVEQPLAAALHRGDHGAPRLRGAKGTASGCRPSRGPRPHSRRYGEEVATNMDLLPTFISLAGAELPAHRVLDGRDISALMRGEPGATSPHEALYYYWETRLDAVCAGT